MYSLNTLGARASEVKWDDFGVHVVYASFVQHYYPTWTERLEDENGEKIIGNDGKPLRKPGIFQSLQAAGWMYDESTAQVSMNLLDYSETGLHDVTEAIRREAEMIGLNVTAGELVGLVPLYAMLAAGQYYQGDVVAYDENSLVEQAISGLMLDKLSDFEPQSCIIEWAISEEMKA